MNRFSRREFQLGALGALLSSSVAWARDWPSMPVRVIIPFAPGGSTDALTRPVLEGLQEKFGQPFLIENRGGGGSIVGTSAAARATPDGYTLLSQTPSYVTTQVVSKTDYTNESFDCVAILATSAYVVLVPTNSPIKDIKGLVEAARKKNGNLLYATAGIGSSTHFATEYFCMRSGVRMKHVPYRGIGPAMIGILSGDCDVIFTTPASGAPQISGGQVRVLAYTSGDVPAGFPPAPTVADSGLDYDVKGWFVLLAPKGTPADILGKLSTEVNSILRTPAIAKIYEGLGAKPGQMSMAQTTELMVKEKALWGEVARVAGIKEQ